MDLINRYLQAVKFWLPSSQQEDIAAELSEDIRSQIEERETALGRKLSDADMEEILKQRGRPLLVAEKYLPQKSLIGPVLFPAYWFVLRLVLLCYLVPWVGVWIGLVVLNPSYRARHFGIAITGDINVLWLNALLAFASVTVIFAVLERLKNKSFLTEWSPRQLPRVRDTQRIPRAGSAIELILGVFFGVWWLKILWNLTVFDVGGVRVALAPAWREFFWVFLLLWAINTSLSATNFVRPYWTRVRRGVRAASNFLSAGVMVMLVKMQPIVNVTFSAMPDGKAAEVTKYLNQSLEMAFAVAAVVLVVVGAVDVWRILARKQVRLNHAVL
jgi:hypothetical protein